MRSTFSLLLLLGLCTACTPEPPAPAPSAGMALPPEYDYPNTDTVQVATWNLQHFVDRHDNPYIDAGRENNPEATTETRLNRVARGLRHLDADLVVLQEAESEAFLQELVQTRLDSTGYRFATSVESPTWYMNVVLLSRFPLGVVHNYADVTTPIAGQQAENGEPAAQSLTNHRLWMADVRIRPEQFLTVVGAHLKAGTSAEDEGWRVGQIRFLHTELARLLADHPDRNILVAGDLNATAQSPELRLLLNNPNRPAPDSLTQSSSVRKAQFTDPLAGQATPTHPSDDPVRQLDYLLSNTSLTTHLVEGSAHVARPLSDSSLAATSDHLPVTASFVFE